ncbi:hypothetical protein HPB51_005104 [Rhipicephalus microplus]|uniref:Uncharacterized protein n=1 Tax=Rhipicephalus microplus TaxID=6941 RepID=A0A9J6EMK7_RHIMP|nr:hypothetical protein HPB51_005104 [Rhipicephalus microplus]
MTLQMECSLLATLTDMYCKLPMAITAENLADKYKISRQDVDQFALRSQKRWTEANKAGRFKEEIVPVQVRVKGKDMLFDTDEHPRPDSTIETLAKLPALFKKDGTVTAGNASGICDGAGAIVVASEDAVKKHNLKPLARIVGYSYVGVDPAIMGIGPVPAIRQLCEKTGVNLQDLDLIDSGHEAYRRGSLSRAAFSTLFSTIMNVAIPLPPFLQCPGLPSIPWRQWHPVLQVYIDAASRDATAEHKKALLQNALGVESLNTYLRAVEYEQQPVADRPTRETTTDVFDIACGDLRRARDHFAGIPPHGHTLLLSRSANTAWR